MAGSVPPARAERLLTGVLGVVLPLTVAGLRDRAERTLGQERLELAWRFVRQARLTNRYSELANVAALTVGTDLLGLEWWDRPVVSAYPRDWHPFSEELREAGDVDSSYDPTVPVSPSEVLQGRFGFGPNRGGWGSPLGTLSGLVADEVAGPAIDFVDLNWPGLHVIEWPEGVGPGEQVALAYDPGGRIRGTTLHDEEGRQMVRVDQDSHWHSDPAAADWAVGVSWQGTVVRLPGEHPGGPGDPWSGPLSGDDRVVAAAIQGWAATLGMPSHLCEPAWTTRDELAEAWVESRAEWGNDAVRWDGVRGGHRLLFQRMTSSLLDGTPLDTYELSKLDPGS